MRGYEEAKFICACIYSKHSILDDCQVLFWEWKQEEKGFSAEILCRLLHGAQQYDIVR